MKCFLDSENLDMDELVEQVSRLSVSLSKEASECVKLVFSSEGPSLKMKESAIDLEPFPNEYDDIHILDPTTAVGRKNTFDLIVLSDDENEALPSEVKIPDASKKVPTHVDNITSNVDLTRKKDHRSDPPKHHLSKTFLEEDVANDFVLKRDSDKHSGKQSSASSTKSEIVDNNKKKKISGVNSLKPQARGDLKNLFEDVFTTKNSDKASERVVRKTDDKLLKDIVSNAEDDPLESALNSLRRQPSSLAKPSIQAPKRQVIQLGTPIQNRSGHLHRLEARTRRFKPPRLDEWYKPILEIDYFATVEPSSSSRDDIQAFGKLKEVPVCFQSPQEYIDIFRPLVLEEFKAQLQSSFLELPSLEDIYFGVISVLSVERIDAFHLVRFAHDDSDSTALKSFAENDLVLLTKEPPQKSSHDVHVVGKVLFRSMYVCFLFQN